MKGLLVASLLIAPFLVYATPQPQASTTVTLVDIINESTDAFVNGNNLLQSAQLSAVGTAKGGAATTYDVEVLDTATTTNAAGATVTSVETEHATFIEGSKGYTLSVASTVEDSLLGTGTIAFVEECTFGGNCIDVLALPAGAATTTYSGTTQAFATVTAAASNSAMEGYHLGWHQLASVVAGVLVGLLAI